MSVMVQSRRKGKCRGLWGVVTSGAKEGTGLRPDSVSYPSLHSRQPSVSSLVASCPRFVRLLGQLRSARTGRPLTVPQARALPLS